MNNFQIDRFYILGFFLDNRPLYCITLWRVPAAAEVKSVLPRHPGELMPELPEQQLSFENLNYFWLLWKGFGNLHGHQQ
jgi:hypothetical protein